MRSIKIITIYLLLFAYSTIVASEVRISSNPVGALVYVENSQTGKKIEIGKTPILVLRRELEQKNGSDRPFIINIDKEGFVSYRVLFLGFENENIEINANLEIKSDIRQVEDFDALIGEILDIQRLIRTKNYKESLDRLNIIERKFHQFSVIPELKGSIQYLNKDLQGALASYRRAFSLNPKNHDVYRMKKYLETHFGLNK